MFTIDQDASVGYVLTNDTDPTGYPVDSATYVHSKSELAALIQAKPGEWSVALWNQLPGVIPITTPKFRNKSTAVERIWKKLAELYPDAIVAEEMPKAKETNASHATAKHGNSSKTSKGLRTARKANPNNSTKKRGSKSSWAEELIGELCKRFRSGQDFTLPDVYKLIPAFQRRHPNNKNIGACLRRTLAQELRGKGIVKSTRKGTYVMRAS